MKVLLIILLLTVPSFASDFGADTSKGQNSQRDKTLSTKSSMEDRISNLKSMSKDTSSNSSKKNTGSLSGGGGLDLTIPARALFEEEIEYLLPVDLGLAAKAQNGWINSTSAEYFATAAKSGVSISSITDESKVLSYLQEVAQFGARIGQAQLNLNRYLKELGSLKKTKTRDGYEVTGLGADDFILLAAGAWIEAEQITDHRIRMQLPLILNSNKCRLTEGGILCGQALLQLSTPPTLKFKGYQWYGENSFAGISGSYKVSTAWSLAKSLENGSSSTTSIKEQADRLESEGRTKEAVMTRKQGVERSKSNKTSMNPGKHVPTN